MDSVLVIRLSAIGDVTMASGLIHLLRRRYPRARICWLVQPEAKDLLEAHPDLSEVIVWRRGEWRQLARAGHWWALACQMRSFIRTLRKQRFDLAIDAQGLLKSGVWAWLSGARERVGLGSKEGSRWFMTQVIDKPREDERIGSEYRHLAQMLGLEAEKYRMQVAVTEADETHTKEMLRSHGVVGRYAVICPFTTRPQKHWFDDRWNDLARQLVGEFGVRVIMLGGPGDRAAAARLAADDALVDFVGATTLRQAAALIRGAALLVGVDTGLTHLGTAFGIPTIPLFGSTRPYLKTDSPQTHVLYHRLDCSPCYRNPTCGGAFHCMHHIAVDEVIATARRLLA